MAVGPTRPVGAMAPVIRKPRTKKPGREEVAARSIADVTSVMDIPEAEFTPGCAPPSWP